MLLEMPLRFRCRRKGDRRFVAQGRERRHFARVFLPFLNFGRIDNDLNLALVIGEAHPPAKTLLVQIAEPALIIMMIGRAEERPAQPAPRHVGEISFDRLRLDDVDLVKILLSKAKRVPLEKLSIDRDGAVFAQLKKRRLTGRSQLNIVAGGFFQKEPREREKRVGDRARFDLRDDVLKSRNARQKFDGDRRQRPLNRWTMGRAGRAGAEAEEGRSMAWRS